MCSPRKSSRAALPYDLIHTPTVRQCFERRLEAAYRHEDATFQSGLSQTCTSSSWLTRRGHDTHSHGDTGCAYQLSDRLHDTDHYHQIMDALWDGSSLWAACHRDDIGQTFAEAVAKREYVRQKLPHRERRTDDLESVPSDGRTSDERTRPRTGPHSNRSAI